jgi:CBS domain-containing protein
MPVTQEKFVRDIMTTPVITVLPTTPVTKIAQAMVQNDLTGVPVIRKGTVVGIVTDSDLVAQKSNIHSPSYVSMLHAFVMLRSATSVEKEIQKLLGSKAEDIMTSPVISVRSNDTINKLATKMVETKANPVPVIDDGKLVGIVSRHDLLKLVGRDAAPLEQKSAAKKI